MQWECPFILHDYRAIRRIIVVAVLGGLGACSTAPTTRTVDLSGLQSRAETARNTGDLAAAANLYQQMATASRGTERADYLIAAAALWTQLGDYPTAQAVLTEARGDAAARQLAAIEIYSARVDVGLGRVEAALARLDATGAVGDPTLQGVAAEARGLALFALGRTTDAVAVLVEREIWLDSAAAILANQRMIWEGLRAARGTPAPTADELVAGWLALIPLTRIQADAPEFRRALLDWRMRFATHPAASGILAELVAATRSVSDFPQRIALLLPLGSARRIPAQAIRDGFLAARIGDGRAAETTVTVYDTAVRGSADAYVQAQIDGADFIAGPLLREEVESIVPRAGFIPTLALNFSQQTSEFPPGLYQYALAPEDEVHAIAERAIAEGQRRAVALYASDDRGYRLMDSFREAFESLGGEVLAAAAYVPESQNAADPIAEILNIARSEQRHRRLQANLGAPVVFESRRRQDVDMIFLQVGTAALARVIAPELRFNNAGDIPTYATSDVYDTAREDRDSDLNGIIFPDLPILVAPDAEAADFAAELAALWPQRSRQWIRYYSFGFDAYRLIRPLYGLGTQTWPRRGVTGELSLDRDGRVRRALPFAQFRNGEPDALPTPTNRDPFSAVGTDRDIGATFIDTRIIGTR